MMAATDTHRSERPESLILGLGMTGVSLARYLEPRGISARVVDTRDEPPGLSELPATFEFVPGALDVDLLDGVSNLYVTPGLADRAGLIAEARRRGIRVRSDIDLFAAEARAPLITVTGSNGKSTVVSLVAHLLNETGVTATAAGNIGMPVLDLLSQPVPDVYVVELSSFQLERSDPVEARAAALLNVSADHLDWHGSMQAYRAAKCRILARAATAVVPHELLSLVPAGVKRTIAFGLTPPGAGDYGLQRRDESPWLSRGGDPLVAASSLFSATPHDCLNALAALALVEAYGADPARAAQALATFERLPHRGAPVAERDGVKYLDDSKATNVGAAVASIRAAGTPLVLIAGGDAKGADLSPLADALRDHLRAAVVLGRAAPELTRLLEPIAPVIPVTTMRAAVREAHRVARPGDTVLLAPACSSTDMFVSFAERGDEFVRAVEGLPS